MSSGLTYIGANASRLAYAPAPQVTALNAAAAVANVAEAREQIRDQLMAARGVDPLSLFRMSSYERIRAEAAILVEAAKLDLKAQNHARADIRATGRILDLRV